jgi:hypothetical protein
MATLSNDTILALETKILDFKRNPKTTPHGYPVSLVSDLLETLRFQKTLKKKYQRLADLRGKCIMEIFSITSRAVDKTTEALEE